MFTWSGKKLEWEEEEEMMLWWWWLMIFFSLQPILLLSSLSCTINSAIVVPASWLRKILWWTPSLDLLKRQGKMKKTWGTSEDSLLIPVKLVPSFPPIWLLLHFAIAKPLRDYISSGTLLMETQLNPPPICTPQPTGLAASANDDPQSSRQSRGPATKLPSKMRIKWGATVSDDLKVATCRHF